MKKKLNFFCVLMLIVMASQVIMTFVTGADAFAEGWERGRNAEPVSTWSALAGLFMEMLVVIAAISSFWCFVRFILNVNRDKVFVWDNVILLRITGLGLLIAGLFAAVDEFLHGNGFTQVYEDYIDVLLFCVFNLIVAEVFAIGLKLKLEQDLTI